MLPRALRTRAFHVLYVTMALAMMASGLVSPILPLFARSLGASGVGIGLVYSTYSMVRALANPPLGLVSDRIGRKILLSGGMAGMVLVGLGYLLVTSMPQLVLAYGLHGLASAALVPSAMAYVGDSSPSGTEGRHMGRLNRAMILGFGLGPLVGGQVAHWGGLDTVFMALSFLALMALAGVSLLPGGRSRAMGLGQPTGLVWSREVAAMAAVRFFTATGRAAMFAFFAILSVDRVGLGLPEIGAIMAGNLFVMGLLQVPAGHLADKGGLRAMVLVGGLLGAASLALLPEMRSTPGIAAAVLLSGLGGALLLPGVSVYAARIGHTVGMGRVMGIFAGSMNLGMVIGPVIAGAIYDTLGLGWVFRVAAALYLVGTGSFMALAGVGSRPLRPTGLPGSWPDQEG